MAKQEEYTLDELIQMNEQTITDIQYDLEKARSPRVKRSKQDGLAFFGAIVKHLKELKELRDA